jgi:peptidoglycan/LPS O-acetylase OafA/YrhL
LLLTVFILGPLVTESKIIDYLTDPMTWKYLLRNATMLLPAKYELSGVFLDNPYGRAVNGSLWTLPFEIKLYLALALLMRIFTMQKIRNLHYFKIATIVLACALMSFQILDHFLKFDDGEALRLSGFFFSGGAFYLLRHRISISYRYLYVLIAVICISLAINKDLFFAIYSLSLTWLLLHLAYLPDGIIRNYNALGDYSYGVYIYAFPIQQVLILWNSQLSVFEMMMQSLIITTIFSIISWHLIENSYLKFKRNKS